MNNHIQNIFPRGFRDRHSKKSHETYIRGSNYNIELYKLVHL